MKTLIAILLSAFTAVAQVELSGGLEISGGVEVGGVASAVPAAFTPDDLAGLIAWYEADDIGIADGANVTGWIDKSAVGNTLTNDSGRSPIYTNAMVNSHDAVYFADADALYSMIGGNTNYQPLTITMAVKLLDFVGVSAFVGGTNLSVVDSVCRHGSGNGLVGMYCGTAVTATDINWLTNDWGVITWQLNGSSSIIRTNNVEAASGLNPGTLGFLSIAVGGNEDNLFLNGWVAALCIYTNALDASQMNQVEDYLNDIVQAY